MAPDLSGSLNCASHPAPPCRGRPADRTFVPRAGPEVTFVTYHLVGPTGLISCGSVAGGTSMKSESARLLRQWWNEPGDYSWVIEFYRRRGLISALRASNAFGGVITFLASLSLLFEQLITPFWLSHALVLGMLVGSLGWILFWCFF